MIAPRSQSVWRAAVVGWTLVAASGTAAITLRILDPVPILANDYGVDASAIIPVVILAFTWSTVGAVLMIRCPENVVGRWVLLVGVGHATTMLAGSAASSLFAQGPELLPLTRWVAWLGGVTTLFGGFVFYLAVIFPTGRGHTPGWDLRGRILALAATAGAVLVVTMPGPHHVVPGLVNPLGIGPDLRPLLGERPGPTFMVVAASIWTPVAIGAMISRYQSGSRVERAQLRWFVSAVMMTIAALAFVGVASLGEIWTLTGPSVVTFGLVGTSVPIAIGIAVLRYRLYEIDRIISRSIAWALVTGILVAIFAVGVIALQAGLAGLTQGNTIAVAVSTLVAAALFQPLRRRVQQAVDRRFDRARFDSQGTVERFAIRLRDEVAMGSVVADIRETVAASVRPASLGLWLKARR